MVFGCLILHRKRIWKNKGKEKKRKEKKRKEKKRKEKGEYGAYILNYLVSEVKDVHIYIYTYQYIDVCMYWPSFSLSRAETQLTTRPKRVVKHFSWLGSCESIQLDPQAQPVTKPRHCSYLITKRGVSMAKLNSNI